MYECLVVGKPVEHCTSDCAFACASSTTFTNSSTASTSSTSTSLTLTTTTCHVECLHRCIDNGEAVPRCDHICEKRCAWSTSATTSSITHTTTACDLSCIHQCIDDGRPARHCGIVCRHECASSTTTETRTSTNTTSTSTSTSTTSMTSTSTITGTSWNYRPGSPMSSGTSAQTASTPLTVWLIIIVASGVAALCLCGVLLWRCKGGGSCFGGSSLGLVAAPLEDRPIPLETSPDVHPVSLSRHTPSGIESLDLNEHLRTAALDVARVDLQGDARLLQRTI